MESLPEILQYLQELWNFKLTTVDAQPITLGKLIAGILIFGVGYMVVKRVTHEIEKRFLVRLEVEESLRYSLKTAVFLLSFNCISFVYPATS